MNRLKQISQAFSEAALTYDQHDFVQRHVAMHLAEMVKTENESSLGTVLDVGCGTGFLAEQLYHDSEKYVLLDISHDLLKVAQHKLSADHVLPVQANGEAPCFTACFDLIVSNLALHWFENPKLALSSLTACLKPGGRLYLSALGNNTFYEWRTAHMVLDASCGLLEFITMGQLKDWLPLSGDREVYEEWIKTTPKNSLEFLKHLKGIGGYVSHPGHRPLPIKTFRAVMNEFDVQPKISYQILYAKYIKPEKVREE